MLKIAVENVGRVREKIRAHVGSGRAGNFITVFFQLLLAVAPGEIGVTLLKSDFCKRLHHWAAREGLGQEDDIWIICIY